MLTKATRTAGGTTVLEVLMAIFVLLVGVTSILALFPIGVHLSQMSADDAISALTVQNAIADLRAQTGPLARLQSYADTNNTGDALSWDSANSKSLGIDGAGGSVVNVGGTWLGKTKLEPTLYMGGTLVSAAIPRTGLAAWFDAGAGMTLSTGNVVETWMDQSGNGRHATRLDGSPTYVSGAAGGRPAVRFSTDAPAPGASLKFSRMSNMRTVFWVLKDNCPNTAAHRHNLLRDSGGSNDFYRGANGNIWDTASSSSYIRAGTTRLNGTVVNGTTTVLPFGSFNIVSVITTWSVSADTITWYGDIAEIIIYTTELGPADEAAVGAYLTAKYGLTTNYGAGSSATAVNMFNTKLNTGETTRNDCALMLMTSGKAQWKLYRLDDETVFSPAMIASTVNGYTDFPADGVQAGDNFKLIGARDIHHVWVTAPERFYGDGGPPASYRLGKGAANGYGYLAIIQRVSGSATAFRVHILVYRNYDESLPPEGNTPAIACYTTILSSDALR